MRKKCLTIISIFILILLLPLVSCGKKKTSTANTEVNTYTVTLDATGYTYSGETSYNVKCGETYKFDVVSGTAGWGYNNILVTDKDGNVSSWSIASDIVLKPILYSYTDSDKNSIYFGFYPQTKVSDDSIISSLNTKAGTLPTSTNTYNWIDYGYYIEGSVSSYMYYIDIDEDSDGDYDYRGVYFTDYRPWYTRNESSYNYQSKNLYFTNAVYWFKYEPIKWNILKTENNKALIVSDLILDSQDYYHTENDRSGATDYQGNSTTDNVYANNYMYSYIRSWLNTTFYDTAFSTLEKQIIEITEVDNSPSSTSNSDIIYSCSNTNDKIFLLSYKEETTYYKSKTDRYVQVSDYAVSQGLNGGITSSSPEYWLRSPFYYHSDSANSIYVDGDILGKYVDSTCCGVRAACWIDL